MPWIMKTRTNWSYIANTIAVDVLLTHPSINGHWIDPVAPECAGLSDRWLNNSTYVILKFEYHCVRYKLFLSSLSTYCTLSRNLGGKDIMRAWRHHHMESFSVLLASFEENLPLSGFHSQNPLTRSFDVFFGVCLNKRFNKQWSCRWFDIPWYPCDVT